MVRTALALFAAITYAVMPAPVMAQGSIEECAGCGGGNCMLGCPVGNPSDCGACSDDGKGACAYVTGGCGQTLLDAAGLPLLASSDDPSTRAIERIDGDRSVVVRRCDDVIIARRYSPAEIDRSRATVAVLSI